MKKSDYETILAFIKSSGCMNLNELIEQVKLKFESNVLHQTLLSICLIYHQQRVKCTISKKSSDENVNKYHAQYLELKENSGKDFQRKSILVDISSTNKIPPSLLARLILHRHLASSMKEADQSENEDMVSFKTTVSKLIKDPFLIEDERLCWEVRQCVLNDLGYGPVTDSIRHMIGLEYEEKLVNCVKQLDIPFQTEVDLKKLGYDKTPDIKLEIPFQLKDQVVCWIESKASFGTPEAHTQYVNNQYQSYWNRFGPGLVIYWFGFVDELASDMLKKNILIMDKFPNLSEISFYDPLLVKPYKT